MKGRIEQIKRIHSDWMRSEFYPPAADPEIAAFEKAAQIVIPESCKAFLRLSNGAELFGGDCFLYGIAPDARFQIGYDFSDGRVPEELLIVGFYHSSHICYDARYGAFFFYEYEDYDSIKEECPEFSDFYEVLDYILDIAMN